MVKGDWPLIVKGIVREDDALLCLELNVDAIWASNHGGRQLDSGLSSLEVLEDICITVDNEIPVIFDGGVRTGTDVIKALALGANVVALGRLALFGLIMGGEDGIHKVYELLKEEILATMAMCGIRTVNEIDRSFVKVRW